MHEPEILTPGVPSTAKSGGRTRLGGPRGMFRDETIDTLAHLLDDVFQIPGTKIRFGIDGIIGLVPGMGDALGGLASAFILLAAWMRGAPYITLVRMTVNIVIDVGVGAIPFAGDLFDVVWKANRRNYALLRRHIDQPAKHHLGDWLFLLALALILALVFTVPILVSALLLRWLLTGR